MKILVTGSHGLIGNELVAALTKDGHAVVRAARGERPSNGVEAVVHLAGEPIAGRWTKRKKLAIRESRVAGTRALCEALPASVRLLVSASAIGFYGDRGTEPLNDDSAPGKGFLAEVVRDWEAATKPAADAGIRVVNLRFGMVLSAKGGALAKMLLPFKLGAGGIVGSGRQFWSWIALEDAVRAIQFALATESLHGPVNVVSPQPVTNKQFTKTLGKVLGRPTIFPMPDPIARVIFGEMAGELLLVSQQVYPFKLEGSGYRFRYRDLETALRAEL
jgi:uncharacterized protein (TIGR01777 family)